jgi:long-chain fatty acid transport protein
MRRALCFFCLALPAVAVAGGFESPGVGAKALGMGGAFVGLADDWTASFWNPGGLAQQEKGEAGTAIDVVVSRELDGNSIANPSPPFTQGNIERGDLFVNLSGPGEPPQFNANTVKMVVPIPAVGGCYRWGRWVGAISLYTPLGFSSHVADRSVPGLFSDYRSQVNILMPGLSLATELWPGILVGAGVHALVGHLQTDATKVGSGYVQSNHVDGSAIAPEGIVGVLLKPNDRIQLGFVYRTPATMRFSGTAQISDTRFPQPSPFGTLQNERSEYRKDMQAPATYGAGIACRVLRRWRVTADWQGTDWRTMREEMTFDRPGLILRNSDFDPRWKFTHRYRGGIEFKPKAEWAIRAGFFVDPQAMPDEAQSMTGIIDVTRRFVTSGFGWTGETLGFNMGYLYGWGRHPISGVDFERESHSFLMDVVWRWH